METQKTFLVEEFNAPLFIEFTTKLSKISKTVYLRINENVIQSDLYNSSKTEIKMASIERDSVFHFSENPDKEIKMTFFLVPTFWKVIKMFKSENLKLELLCDEQDDCYLVEKIKVYNDDTEIEYHCSDHSLEYQDLKPEVKDSLKKGGSDSLSVTLDAKDIDSIIKFFSLDETDGKVKIMAKKGNLVAKGSKYESIIKRDIGTESFSGVWLSEKYFSVLDGETYTASFSNDPNSNRTVFKSEDSETCCVFSNISN